MVTEKHINDFSRTAYNYIHNEIGISECTLRGVTANIKEWAEHKTPLIDLLKKHPNWSEKDHAVIIDYEEKRELDNNYFSLCSDLYSLQFDYHNPEISKAITDRCCTPLQKLPGADKTTSAFCSSTDLNDIYDNIIHYCFSEKLSRYAAQYLNLINPSFTFQQGQRSSRVLRKIFAFMYLDKHPDFEKLFAKISDCLSVKSLKRKAVLSVNPMDFLTMSNGNSWSTCVCLKPTQNYDGYEYQGKHRAGILSHLTDNTSCIFYTLDRRTGDNPIWHIPKLTRQIIFYDYPHIVHERIYPKNVEYNTGENNPYNVYAEIVRNIFAKCENRENRWYENNTIIHLNLDSFMYPDWKHYTSLRFKNPNSEKTTNTVSVGGKAYCIHCGSPKYRTTPDDNDIMCATLLCEDCFGSL